MKIPINVKLNKAIYLRDYTYRFEFSDGVISDVDFELMLTGTLSKFLDINEFKKMKCDKNFSGDIYWGKNWDMCFNINQYYKETKINPVKINKSIQNNLVISAFYSCNMSKEDGYDTVLVTQKEIIEFNKEHNLQPINKKLHD
jgi:hypothetical protein